jgi:hypothetical protein
MGLSDIIKKFVPFVAASCFFAGCYTNVQYVVLTPQVLRANKSKNSSIVVQDTKKYFVDVNKDILYCFKKNCAVFVLNNGSERQFSFGNFAEKYINIASDIAQPCTNKELLSEFMKADENNDEVIDGYEAKNWYRDNLLK